MPSLTRTLNVLRWALASLACTATFGALGFAVAAIWVQREPLKGNLSETAWLCALVMFFGAVAVALLSAWLDYESETTLTSDLAKLEQETRHIRQSLERRTP